MKSELLEEIRRKTVKNFLDVVILTRLRGQALSGYEITEHIFRKYSVLLSSGTVYSRLHCLERADLIRDMWDRRRTVYRLTEKGDETAESFLKLKEELLSVVLSLFTK